MKRPWKMVGLLLLAVAVTGYPYSDTLDLQIPFLPEQQDTQQTADEFPHFYDDHYPEYAENQGGFTLTCPGDDKICLHKHVCPHGYVSADVIGSFLSHPKTQGCRVEDEVCCSVIPATAEGEGVAAGGEAQEEVEQESFVDFDQAGGGENAVQTPSMVDEGTGLAQAPDTGVDSGSAISPVPDEGTDAGVFVAPVQVGCAAALLCVEEKFCTLDGTISPTPVSLTAKQLLRRVPLSSCKNPENGVVGKCCRDPNYVDPWPTGGLPANYTGGFDEQGFPTFLNIAKVRPPKKSTKTPVKTVQPVQVPRAETPAPNSVATLVNDLEGPSVGVGTISSESSDRNSVAIPPCGVKNKVIRPPEMDESETLFAEIPWQAMVLHSEQKKILCSGALINQESILTAANCVDSLSPHEVSIKLGEWKLGYELKHEEPLPFEILNVASIKMHPGYTKGQSNHDIALLRLDRPAKLDFHVNPLCLPEVDRVPQESRRCLTTGWGKIILQSHYAGAIMHSVDVDVLSPGNCRNRLYNGDLGLQAVEEAICTKTKYEKNNMCEADVGGPLACENERGVFELTGIYSQDTGCQPTDQVAVFAPVDAAWVNESLNPIVRVTPEVREPEYSSSTSNYRESSLSTDNQYLPPF